MAVRRLAARHGLHQPRFPGMNAPFSPSEAADLLMHRQALCIQKALEKSVIRVAGAKRLGHEYVN
ncbi:hypothetical protein RFM26_07030 [Mesorhizobium sp. VK23B]|uniref:Uncharacterized protein n=1 Tax=Mesorhizobium dulcispinae TaxID=3072316 RepID=A0ABU4XEI1_9HYPH|nr:MULTISPECIES: hypothetical protein [unclassified Mesorhizobium]MDX8465434.1 hypothetical protein [Mesorhizobium sp. VK23B]MDX8472923.1 hypothetical protein [Mesorhizobium sp. VK23A]